MSCMRSEKATHFLRCHSSTSYLLILRESKFDNSIQSDHSVLVVLEDANLKPRTNPASKTGIMFKYITWKK